MADQKRWFKVWTSILLDPAMNSMDLADIGRWVRLGALAAAVGERGQLTFPAGGDGLVSTLRVVDLVAAKSALLRLPHVVFEEGKTANGDFTVTFSNWRRYQEDSSVAERVRRLRNKRRREEKREEENKEVPPLSPFGGDARELLRFLNEKTGRSYRATPTNLRLIEARLRSGATVENCRGVIARKVREWSNRPEMRQYLRPATLFNATKFEQYLGEREATP